MLRWKLGLRNPTEIDITQMGLKMIDLSRNKFGDYFVEQISITLSSDEYLRCLILKKNQISISGMKTMAQSLY